MKDIKLFSFVYGEIRTKGKTDGDYTLAGCWDTDRLGIDWVGLVLDPSYFFTEMRKELAYLKYENEGY
jgi:hypothetical protein